MQKDLQICYNISKSNLILKQKGGPIMTRQINRARTRKRIKEQVKHIRSILKELNLSNYEYVADDNDITFSAFSPHLLDFLKVLGIEDLFQAHVNLNKRKSPYSSSCLSKLLITHTILGYDRIETSRTLDLDEIYKQKLELENYPDPETFRDELNRYNSENIDQLFIVNRKILYSLVKLEQPQYINLHFDAKVITLYGDQEEAQVGYNPHKRGRKSYQLKLCTVEPFGFVLAIRLEPGNAVSTTEFGSFYRQCMDAIPTEHFVVHTVRLDKGFFSENNIQMLEGDYPFFEIAAKQYKSLKDFIQAIQSEF